MKERIENQSDLVARIIKHAITLHDKEFEQFMKEATAIVFKTGEPLSLQPVKDIEAFAKKWGVK